MKILHYLPAVRLTLGGIVRAVIDQSTLLAARGHRVTLMTHDDVDIPDAWADGVDHVPIVARLGSPERSARLLSGGQRDKARALIREADVLHLHGCWNPGNNQLARDADAAGVPYVQSVHGMLDDWSMTQSVLKKRLFLALGGKRTLVRARRVHCTAEAELAQARRWFSPGEGVVCPLVFDLSPYRELPGPGLAREAIAEHLGNSGEPVVLFLARIHRKKGVDVFIRAAAELARRGVAFRAVIAGTSEHEGYMDEMRRLARTEGLADRVAFVGHVSGDLKTSLFELAAVFAGPTSQENFGFVFPEALACGTPVVTTRGVDIHSELEASGGAVIADRTPGAFADAIAGLLADPERSGRMGASGRAWVFEHLDPDAVAARYESLYTEAVGCEPIRNGARPGPGAEQ